MKLRGGARYFSRPFATPAWEKVYNETLKDDTTWLIGHLAHDSVAALKKQFIPARQDRPPAPDASRWRVDSRVAPVGDSVGDAAS